MSAEHAVDHGQWGATLVEFALVLPILVFLTFGMIEFGRILNAQIIVTHAAREGARHASLGESATAVAAHVVASCPTLDETKLAVTVSNAGGASGSAVSVEVVYPVEIAVPLIADLLGGETVDVRQKAVMRLE